MKNKDLRKEAIAIQTRAITLSLVAVFLIYLTLSMSSASALLGLPEQSTKDVEDTTISWDSSFQDPDFTLGNTITMQVTWTVDAGAAIFDDFVSKRFTPRSKKDPATGALLGVTLIDDSDDDDDGDGYDEGMVEVRFNFTGLHLDKRRNVEIGNAHFKLYLLVAEDLGGPVDLLAGFGVNVHIEDQL